MRDREQISESKPFEQTIWIASQNSRTRNLASHVRGLDDRVMLSVKS